MSSTRRKQNSNNTCSIPLKRPNPSDFNPSQETLLDIATKRGIINPSTYPSPDSNNEPIVGRGAEATLWSLSLAILHFTLDVLVHHQYAQSIQYKSLAFHSLQAFAIFLLLFYTFHRHPQESLTLPNILPEYQGFLHQALFFVVAVVSGCYMIYITNEHAYIAVMKKAPALGCLWIWSVIELELRFALPSLMVCLGFFAWGGYTLT